MLKSVLNNIVAVFVIVIVLAIILPLNRIFNGALIDFLLMVNISLSIVILLLTMYIKKPLEFSLFPTVLLVTTVFRLALNVSTTRGILSSGYAGQVVKTFGEFVMAGDPVVGFIIFVIIVLVNMLVITKGSERVSEVAARFTLDAMPGKQMAIDADLNAGTIDEHEAIARRSEIQQEADFFGAMDGATKFVKGDATLSIVTSLINLIGGAALGAMRGIPLGEVLQQYSLATVGDGLASQIPALLVSTATGMVVTRTSSRQGTFNEDIIHQFTQNANAILITGLVVFGLMFIPGFPKPIMFIISAALILFAVLQMQRKRREAVDVMGGVGALAGGDEASPPGGDDSSPAESDYYRNIDNIYKILPIEQIEMEFGYSLLHLVDERSGGNTIERVVVFRKQFAMEMGMVFPSVRMRNNPEINPNQYLIKIKGEEVARGEILVDHYLAIDNGDVTSPVDGIDTVEPAFGIPARWISEDKKVMADVAGYTLIDPVSVMITHLSEVIKTHCYEILTRQDVNTMVGNIKAANPTLVEDLIPNVIGIGYLQKVLAMLLKEGVPVRDLETILETLADNAGMLKDIDVTVEYVRQALRRTITRRFTESGTLRSVALDPALEDLIIRNIKRVERGGSMLNLDPETTQAIISATSDMADRFREMLPYVIVITSAIVRVYFKKLIEPHIPDVVVLSYQEIEGPTVIQSLATITIPMER